MWHIFLFRPNLSSWKCGHCLVTRRYKVAESEWKKMLERSEAWAIQVDVYHLLICTAERRDQFTSTSGNKSFWWASALARHFLSFPFCFCGQAKDSSCNRDRTHTDDSSSRLAITVLRNACICSVAWSFTFLAVSHRNPSQKLAWNINLQ